MVTFSPMLAAPARDTAAHRASADCACAQVVLPEGAYDIAAELSFEAELSYEPK